MYTIMLNWSAQEAIRLVGQIPSENTKAHTSMVAMYIPACTLSTYKPGADLGGGSRGSGPPLSYMKNDVMHTVIYAAFCMLPSLDLQDCTSF